MSTILMFLPYILGLLILGFLPSLLGVVVIKATQVGIVIKKFSSKNLSAGRLIATNGEAGIQADVLSPGWHLFLFPWQYSIRKENVIQIPGGYLGLIVAKDGTAFSSDQILGKNVDCNNFQDAKKFLANGGQKGKQSGILTAGTYRINTSLFEVSVPTKTDSSLKVLQIQPDSIGIVNVLAGQALSENEIAAEIVAGHENFQNAQAFIDAGGKRGLQQQVLLPGSWNINPWFASVEIVPMTEIPIGYVGVINSYCGKEHVDVSGEFKHGELVEQGHKGIWQMPLLPGKYPLNPRTMMLELVPTTNTVLNWADNRTEAHNLDANLSSIHARTSDGFDTNMDVAQIIHISYQNAPRVISRVGSIQNLIDQVLQPTVATYFRNSMQSSTFLDFVTGRKQRQEEARVFIAKAISEYDVEAVDTLIGDIAAPPLLMKTLTDRKIAEEQRKTYTTQMESEKTRQDMVKQTAMADIQTQLVTAEQSVIISTRNAEAMVARTNGDAQAKVLIGKAEAEALTAVGTAQADVYKKNVDAMGQDGYTRVKLIEEIGNSKTKIVPDILVSGGGGSTSEAMLAMILGKMSNENKNSNLLNG